MTIWKCVDLANVFILLHPWKLNAFKAQIFFKAIFNWRLHHHHHHPYFPHFPSQSTQQPIVTRQQTNQPSGETTPASRRRKLSLSRPLTARNVKVVGKKTKLNQTTNWRRAWSSVNRRALEVGRQYQLSRWGYPFNRDTPTPHRILFQAREGREFRYAYCAICSSCVCVSVCVCACMMPHTTHRPRQPLIWRCDFVRCKSESSQAAFVGCPSLDTTPSYPSSSPQALHCTNSNPHS